MTILRNFTALFFFIAAINLANAKPNVLLIVCDDLNTHVSTSGYPHIKTPHLDRLAKAVSPSTEPIASTRSAGRRGRRFSAAFTRNRPAY